MAERIDERPRRAVGDGDSHHAAVPRFGGHVGGVVVEFAVALDHLRGPRLAGSPAEIGRSEHRAVIRPGFHVGCRVAEPFGDVELLSAAGGVLARVVFVVADVEVERAVVHQRRGVGGPFVGDDRISGRHERFPLFRGGGATCQQQQRQGGDHFVFHKRFILKVSTCIIFSYFFALSPIFPFFLWTLKMRRLARRGLFYFLFPLRKVAKVFYVTFSLMKFRQAECHRACSKWPRHERNYVKSNIKTFVSFL